MPGAEWRPGPKRLTPDRTTGSRAGRRLTTGVRRGKNHPRVRRPDERPSDERIADFTRAVMTREPGVAGHERNIGCENAHDSF
jgi:hypothetical protein